jgi:ribosome-binding factor A
MGHEKRQHDRGESTGEPGDGASQSVPGPEVVGRLSGAEPSEPRFDRIGSSIQRAVQRVLTRGLNDPRLDGSMTTVTEVEVALDGRDATVHISVLPAKHGARCIAAIKHAAGFIRREAGEQIRMRSLPQLHFVLDHRLKKHAGIIAALGQAKAQDAQGRHGEPPDGRGGDRAEGPGGVQP